MIDIFVSEDILALFQVLGSARDSRAGEGAPAFANFIPTVRRGRRNEHARAPVRRSLRAGSALPGKS
jgi:hypothetical protein